MSYTCMIKYLVAMTIKYLACEINFTFRHIFYVTVTVCDNYSVKSEGSKTKSTQPTVTDSRSSLCTATDGHKNR